MTKEISFSFNLSGRQAIRFVQTTQEVLKNLVQLEREGRRVSAKSLLGILSLGIRKGDLVTVFYKEEEDFKIIEEIINLIQEELQ